MRSVCSDRKCAVGLETMSLLIRLAFFVTRGDGKPTVGGANLTEGALIDSSKSSYRGPATTSGGGSTPAPPRAR
jgi:hypothetical protein